MSNNLVFLFFAVLLVTCFTGVNGNVCLNKLDDENVCALDCLTLYRCRDGKESSPEGADPNNLCIDGQWVRDAPECPPAEETIETDETFVCSGEGIFPDTRDCSRFYECENNLDPPIHSRCEETYYFNSRTFECEPLEDGECANTICPTKVTGDGVSFAYEMNPSFYTICRADGKVELKQCPDSENQKFNGVECIFECVKRGIFEDVENCRQYYYCRYNTGLALTIPCIANYRFENNQCVRLTNSNMC